MRSLSVLVAALLHDRLSRAVDPLGAQLADWGKVVRLQTTGRVTGHSIEVAIGFIEEPDGSLLVAAGDPGADWARNLDAEPHAQATIADRSFAVVAEPLDPPAAAKAVFQLILKYGTTAERLGHGPAFRLRPAAG